MALKWAFSALLPVRPIVASVGIPTAYLWVVDSISLKRGTWVIGEETKLGLYIGKHLEIEYEALFFFVSNVLIVVGLVTMDHALAISEYKLLVSKPPEDKPQTFSQLAWSYLSTRERSLDLGFLEGMSAAIDKLAQKIVDDLVDEAPDRETARANVQETSQVLHWRFSTKRSWMPLYNYVESERVDSKVGVSSPLITSIALLPVSRLTINPLLELLSGFEMDLGFCAEEGQFPIRTEEDLEVYAYRVAGTVAASLLELVFAHYGLESINADASKQSSIIQAGEKMGQALQYVNIARDIKRDAEIGRVYIPTSWLHEIGSSPSDVIARPEDPKFAALEERMLQKADRMYEESVSSIDQLPREARGPVKTTVESYMTIGAMVRERRRNGAPVKGKLKVPLWRRLGRAWKEML
ncbi:Bifunctional lycopene cyclase/phytoene synthase [Penicillium chermesinum]|nr:Bifunctional lycopene cyclase/phytoene synthase [Penicillium chermesinum]